ncbi:hypothetical protein JQN58_18150 [Aneurinibacillus sp. BA2021]|nr:hypothetical protein [Aneurinibacillus sp. BA2021]
MITCTACGKTQQGRQIGSHWICGDCKVEDVTEAAQTQADNRTDKGNVH